MSITQLAIDADDKTKETFINEILTECKKVRRSGMPLSPTSPLNTFPRLPPTKVLKANLGNRCAKYAIQYLEGDGKSLSTDGKRTLPPFLARVTIQAYAHRSTDLISFYKCIRTGLENSDSSLGCYAMAPTDLEKFSAFFDKVIRDYHGDETNEKTHITDWSVEVGTDFDVSKLGQDELSMRVRVGRNLLGFNLPGSMDQAERIKFEQKMVRENGVRVSIDFHSFHTPLVDSLSAPSLRTAKAKVRRPYLLAHARLRLARPESKPHR